MDDADRRKKTAIKYFSNPLLRNVKVIDDNILAVELKRKTVNFNRLWLNGNLILDNSKILMIEKIYTLLGNMYKHNFKFIATDTDSIICMIKNMCAADVYKKIGENIDEFDGESFKGAFETIPLVNRKVNRILGDEVGGRIVKHFTWLRPKSYHIEISKKNENETENKIALKGIPRKISYNFTLKDFQDVLKHQNSLYSDIMRFERLNLNIYTISQRKKALTTTFNGVSKRHFISASESLAYGHFEIRDEVSPPWEDENEENEKLTLAEKLKTFKKKFIIIKNFTAKN